VLGCEVEGYTMLVVAQERLTGGFGSKHARLALGPKVATDPAVACDEPNDRLGEMDIETVANAAGDLVARELSRWRQVHRIRHYGFLANGHRDEKLALCRQLLAVAPAIDHSASVLHHGESAAIVLDPCPYCGGMMITLATLPQSVPYHPSFWHDSS
jgi:hypothetical protein